MMYIIDAVTHAYAKKEVIAESTLLGIIGEVLNNSQDWEGHRLIRDAKRPKKTNEYRQYDIHGQDDDNILNSLNSIIMLVLKTMKLCKSFLHKFKKVF